MSLIQIIQDYREHHFHKYADYQTMLQLCVEQAELSMNVEIPTVQEQQLFDTYKKTIHQYVQSIFEKATPNNLIFSYHDTITQQSTLRKYGQRRFIFEGELGELLLALQYEDITYTTPILDVNVFPTFSNAPEKNIVIFQQYCLAYPWMCYHKL